VNTATQQKDPRVLQMDKEVAAHACQMPGAMHFFQNDGTCVFCGHHRDPWTPKAP
jgi:hypothetical protein